MLTNIDHDHDNFHREPDLNCLPFQIYHYMAYVDIGSYIEFINNVVDACFAEKFQQEFDKMNLKNFDFLDFINQKMNYPWYERDHMKDFMMI